MFAWALAGCTSVTPAAGPTQSSTLATTPAASTSPTSPTSPEPTVSLAVPEPETPSDEPEPPPEPAAEPAPAPEPAPAEPPPAEPPPAEPPAAVNNGIAEAQRILQKFAIPTGPVDGIWGPQTAQGLCTFRHIAGLDVSRRHLTDTDLATLRQYDGWYTRLSSIPAPARSGRTTYLLATETCQTLLYAQGGAYVKVMRISSGRSGYPTPNGEYWLGRTSPGWSCSTLFPESCYNHTAGANALYPNGAGEFSQYGNMYNKRTFTGAYMLHGSGSVPLYPASHGCVRVSVANSDWLYHNVSNAAGVVRFFVVGSYW